MKVQRTGLPYKPRIFLHALVLVLVPLLIGTALLLISRQLAVHSEQTLAQEIQQSEKIRSLCNLASKWEQLRGTMLARTVLGQEDAGEEGRSQKTDLEEWFADKEDLANSYKLDSETIKDFQQLIFGKADESRTHPAGIPAGVSKPNETSRLLLQTYENGSALKDYMHEAWLKEKKMRLESDSLRLRQQALIYGCCFADLILAVVLVTVASSALVRRLQTLVRNAGTIPGNQPFRERLEGDDELAYLDGELEKAHEQLKAAADHRRSVISMVAHDMRSPLMASLVNLQIIEELDCNLSDEGFEAFDTAYNKISGILDYVNTLLSMHKNEQSTQADSPAPDPENVTTAGTSGAQANAGTSAAQANAGTSPGERVSRWANSAQRSAGSRSGIAACVLDFFRHPRLLQKGLLLVLLPLLFQTGMLFFIDYQMKAGELITTRARRLADIILDMRLAHADLVRGAAARVTYALTANQDLQQIAEAIFKETSHRFDEMKALAGQAADWSNLVALSGQVCQQQIAELQKIKPEDSRARVLKVLMRVSEIDEPLPEAHQMREHLTRLSGQETRNLETLESSQLKQSRDLSKLLGLFMLANFALTLILLLWFKNDTTKRLRALMTNASRLNSPEPLKESLRGRDELAYLDFVLHEARTEIEAASLQRAAMMSSLAEEMNAPLQEAHRELSRLAELEGDCLPEQSRHRLKLAQSQIERLTGLIPDLLTLETLTLGAVKLQIAGCDAAELAGEAIDSVQSLAQTRNIPLVNDCVRLELQADRSRLQQVLINFLANAIKFSPENAPVTLKSEETPAHMIRFSVTDRGPGMEESTRQRVFERFFQASGKHKEKGFGLGLSICKLIVESHRGTVGVESSPGTGSTFWFEVPGSVPPPAIPLPNSAITDYRQEDTLALCLWLTLAGLALAVWIASSRPDYVAKQVAAGSSSTAQKHKSPSARTRLADLVKRANEAWNNKELATKLLPDLNSFISDTKEPGLLLTAYVARGNVEEILDKYREAIKSYESAAQYSLHAGKATRTTARCYAMALIAASDSKKDQQIKYSAEKILSILKPDNDRSDDLRPLADEAQPGLIQSDGAEAIAYAMLADYHAGQSSPAARQKATAYYSRARDLTRTGKCGLIGAGATRKLAYHLFKTGRRQDALNLARELEQEALKSKDPFDSSERWRQLGGFYNDIKDRQHARQSWQKSLEKARDGGLDQATWCQDTIKCLKKLDSPDADR